MPLLCCDVGLVSELRLTAGCVLMDLAGPAVSQTSVYANGLRKGDSHLKRNSLTCTIPWHILTCTLPPHTHLWPPCGSLPSTTCLCIRTRHYPVTLLPVGSGYFRAEPYRV